jgi:aminoglycoside phosphotransferase (APT) family kinase protein
MAVMPTVPEIPHGRTARRLTWEFLPRELRGEIEGRLGGEVVKATSHNGGFTPGFASTLRAENGATLFVKTAHKTAQAVAARSYAIEAASLKRLGSAIPSPRLLWVSEGDWITLGFENVESRPAERPWTDDDFARALDLTEQIAQVPPAADLAPLVEDAPEFLTCWDQVAARDPGHPRLKEASALAESLAAVPATALSHGDLRGDNLLFCGDGTVLACDWTTPALAPAWLDSVTLAIAAYGDGLDVERHLAGRAVLNGATNDEVDAWLAAFAGFMRYSSLLPSVRNSPYLRLHADWYATVAWEWLAERREWNEF